VGKPGPVQHTDRQASRQPNLRKAKVKTCNMTRHRWQCARVGDNVVRAGRPDLISTFTAVHALTMSLRSLFPLAPLWSRRVIASAAGLLLAVAGSAPTAAATLQLRILETTDVHMNLLSHDYYLDKPTAEFGLARTATLIKAARAEVRNSVLFDNGDLIQGSPMGDQVARVQPLAEGQVHPAMKVLNALGVDAANIGNHEFNYGLPFLRRALSGAKFPYVNANVVLAGSADDKPEQAFTPYTILERRLTDDTGAAHTVKIGVIGFVPPQIMMWDRSNLLGKVRVLDIVETARRFVPQMRAQGADVVVAIPHSGLEFGTTVLFAENVVAKLAEVPGIDAILFGHSHGEFPGGFFSKHPKVDLAKGTINGVPAVMAGAWGSHLGVIDLTLDDSSGHWKVTGGQARLRPIWDRATRKALVEPDPEIAALVATEHAATQAHMSAEIARTSAPITSYFALVADDPSVQVVSQAQLAYARQALRGTPYEALPLLSAAAPFKAGGRMGWTYYTDFPAGPIALRHIASLYIYPNTIKAVKVSGAQVRDWLEMSAGVFNRIDPQGAPEQDLINERFRTYNFDVIDGLTYTIDVTQPARFDTNGKLVDAQTHRIRNLQHDGRPLDDAASFIVVTNNYRASGGGGFAGLDGTQIVMDAQDENRQALATYLATAKTLDPSADGNWRLQPVPGVKLRFLSGKGGVAQLAHYPTIRQVRDIGDGSVLYELAP
jgi:2',3'-cyclic-nucleotide 2'-phosphodiesterase / 3'-nucleotidase